MDVRKAYPYLIPGFHAVREAIIHKRLTLAEIWILRGRSSARIKEIGRMAQAKGIVVKYQGAEVFSRDFPDLAHQGIVGLCKIFEYAQIDELIKHAVNANGRGLLVMADHITDEGNLGSLMRTAAYFNAHGLILPKDRSAGVTARLLKRSAGASVHLPIARIVNLVRGIDLLKKNGFWVVGASGKGAISVFDFDWKRDLVLVLGNEKRGLGKEVWRKCHEVVAIPAPGKIESLNVGVAAGVILSEIIRQRGVARTKAGKCG
jgi:23S rRNA (guanosine2251-2'-O)-methyltransferase